MKDDVKLMRTGLQLVTPSQATEILSRNTGNRRVRQWWVDELSAIISRGEWVTTHQGIAFDDTGNLIDGQHRLMAIIKADTPVLLQVTGGLSSAAFYALDRGVTRDLSDVLLRDRRIIDPCSYALRAAIGGRPTPVQVERVVQSDFGELAAELIASCGGKARVFGSASFKAACITQVLSGAASKQYAFDSYRQLVMSDFQGMSPMVAASYRQLSGQRVHHSPEFAARALATFDEGKQLVSRLVIARQTAIEGYQAFRDVLKKVGAI